MQKARFSPRKPFVGLALCAAAGILCADSWALNPYALAAVLLPCAVFLLVRPNPYGCWAFTAAAFCLFHTVNHGQNPGRRLAEDLGSHPQVAQVSGIVADEPESAPGFRGVLETRFRLRLESGVLLSVRWRATPPQYGDSVSCVGTLTNIAGPRNPAEFDFASYMKRLGIYSEMDVRYPTDGRITGSGRGNPVVALVYKARRWMQAKLTLDLEDSPDIAGLIQSLILGLKRETPVELRELFRRTGTLHLFTVNGLHIAMLASIAWILLKTSRIGRRRAVLVIIPLLAFYATVTGLSPGSVRATVMAIILLGGELSNRRPVALNSLAAAAFGLLLWDTEELFMPGFQFSFGVVLAIILIAGPLRRRLVAWARPDPFLPRPLWSRGREWGLAVWSFFAALLAVSIAAWIGSLPFTTEYLHLASPAAMLVNVAVVPIAYGILMEGILALLAAPFWSFLTILFNNANFALAHLILLIVHFFAWIAYGHFYLEVPRFPAPVCELTVLDLGDGGAIHLRARGNDWLVDTGNKSPYKYIVEPYLRSRGVNRLDGLLLTHGRTNSLGAASEALADFAPRRIVLSPFESHSRALRPLQAALPANNSSPDVLARGAVVQLASDVTLRILYPPPELLTGAAGDRALVVQLEAGGTKVLLTSASGFFTEHWLLDHEPNLKSDILVKGQNDADVSGSLDFIEAAAPAAVVCGAGRFGPGAHIPDSWAADLAARGIRLFRQDQTGAVHIDLWKGNYAIDSFLGKQSFRGSPRP